MSGFTSSSSSNNVKAEIVRLVKSQKEKASLLAYFTKHQDQQAEAFSDLGNFEEDEDKLSYLKTFLSGMFLQRLYRSIKIMWLGFSSFHHICQ